MQSLDAGRLRPTASGGAGGGPVCSIASQQSTVHRQTAISKKINSASSARQSDKKQIEK